MKGRGGSRVKGSAGRAARKTVEPPKNRDASRLPVPSVDPRFFEAALEGLPLSVIAVDERLNVAYLNPAAEETLGQSMSRARGHPVSQLDAGKALGGLLARAVSHLETVTGPAGRAIVLASPLFVEGRPLGALAALLPPAAETASLDLRAMASGLAHEIRNPLSGLKGSAQLLLSELPADTPLHQCADLIHREAVRIDALCGRMLDLSRPLELAPARLNLHRLLDEALATCAAQGGRVKLVRAYDPSLPELRADGDRLAQVLLNLLRNAIESLGESGGTVTLLTGPASVRVRKGDREVPLVRVCVRDDGPGIPEAMLSRLFTPFATSKPKGTGLGLCIARRIAEAHGGRLELRNLPGRGAEASLLLPTE